MAAVIGTRDAEVLGARSACRMLASDVKIFRQRAIKAKRRNGEPAHIPQSFDDGLDPVMAVAAKRLPVCRVAKQNLVTSMRDDVIDERGSLDLAVGLTANAKRRRPQMRARFALPPAVISTRECRSASLIVLEGC